MQDEELLKIALEDFLLTRIYTEAPEVLQSFSIRLEKAYPLYDLGWEERFDRLLSEINTVQGLYSIGRSGLFLHCNIDHAILQGLELSSQILNTFSDGTWKGRSERFREFSARD